MSCSTVGVLQIYTLFDQFNYAHDEWSMRDLLHWQNYPSLPITFPCFESRGVKIFKCSRPEYS
jgi:hypothetical protein